MNEKIEIEIRGNVGIGKSSIARVIYNALINEGIKCCADKIEDNETINMRPDTSNVCKEKTICIIKERNINE